jgi:hypothetical protein
VLFSDSLLEKIMSRENHVSQSMTYKLRRIPLADLEQAMEKGIDKILDEGKCEVRIPKIEFGKDGIVKCAVKIRTKIQTT